MTEKQFLYVADLHIATRTWTNNTQLTGDAYEALAKLTRQTPNSCRTLVIGGDLLDTNRPTSTDLIETCKFISQFDKVYYISGNHDNIQPSFIQLLGEVISREAITQTCEVTKLHEDIFYQLDDDVYITGVSWMHSAPQLKEQIKQTIQTFASDHYEHDVLYLVLHTSFKHLLAFDGAHKLEAKDIQDIIDTVKPTIRILVGDIHTRNTLSLEGGDNSYIHSSGSLYPLSFDKSGDTHSMSLITADSGAIEPIDCTVRKYSSITYSDKQSLKAYTDKLVQANPTDFLQPFVNVIIPETVDVQLHTSEYPGVIIRCVKERQEEIEQSEIARRTGYTLEQAVEDEIGEGEEVLQDLAAALYASDDPLAEINNWLNYWEVEKV